MSKITLHVEQTQVISPTGGARSRPDYARNIESLLHRTSIAQPVEQTQMTSSTTRTMTTTTKAMEGWWSSNHQPTKPFPMRDDSKPFPMKENKLFPPYPFIWCLQVKTKGLRIVNTGVHLIFSFPFYPLLFDEYVWLALASFVPL
jgi:hypothetical protein